MLTRILIAFVLFAGLAYYFNIDVRTLVDKSGVPAWLTSRGYATHASTTPTTTTESVAAQ